MKLKKINVPLAVLAFIIFMSFSFNASATSLVKDNIIKNLDISHDSMIDVADLALIALNYNYTSTKKNWNDSYDINNDLIIDIYDLTLMSKCIGSKMSFDNKSITVNQYESFSLPSLFTVTLSNGSNTSTPVVWNNSIVGTQTQGVFKYTGTLTDYNRVVTVTLNIFKSTEDTINHGNIINSGVIAKQGEWMYYLNAGNEGKLSKINSDGSIVKKLTEDIPYYINVLGGWVYYSNASDNLYIYKVRVDGTERTKLNSDKSEFINVVGEWIYYQNDADDYRLYKIKLDGTQRTKITEDRALYINVVGEWVYYCNYSNYGEICKVRTDGTGKTTLNNDCSSNMILDGNCIYYTKAADQNSIYSSIYKINLDGSNRTEVFLYGAGSFNVLGGCIYFPHDTLKGRLEKMKTDGTEWATVTYDSFAESVNIIDDNIYFIDTNDYNLYKIKNDGSQKGIFGLDTDVANVEDISTTAEQGCIYEFPTSIIATMSDGSVQYVPVSWNYTSINTSTVGNTFRLQGNVNGYSKYVNMTVTVVERINSNGNSVNEALVAQSGDWIYYKNNSDGKLYKMRSDSSDKVMLTDDVVSNIHIVGDWIYYIADSSWNEPRVFKVKIDGTERSKLTDDKTWWFNVMGDWIIYTNSNDNYSLYKIKTDGSNVTKLNNESSMKINVENDWIYYINTSDFYIYKMKPDGYFRTKISEDRASEMNVYNGYVYYTNMREGDKLYRIKTDGTAKEKICDDWALYLNVSNDWIYYSNNSDGCKLYKIKTDGASKTLISPEYVKQISVIGDWIYYKINSDDYVYRIKINGSCREKLN